MGCGTSSSTTSISTTKVTVVPLERSMSSSARPQDDVNNQQRREAYESPLNDVGTSDGWPMMPETDVDDVFEDRLRRQTQQRRLSDSQPRYNSDASTASSVGLGGASIHETASTASSASSFFPHQHITTSVIASSPSTQQRGQPSYKKHRPPKIIT